jgi:hypothetical protein
MELWKLSSPSAGIASAVWCLGKTRHGDARYSFDHLQEAYQLFNTLSDEVESQRLGSQCGMDLVNVARLTLQDKGKAVPWPGMSK